MKNGLLKKKLHSKCCLSPCWLMAPERFNIFACFVYYFVQVNINPLDDKKEEEEETPLIHF